MAIQLTFRGVSHKEDQDALYLTAGDIRKLAALQLVSDYAQHANINLGLIEEASARPIIAAAKTLPADDLIEIKHITPSYA